MSIGDPMPQPAQNFCTRCQCYFTQPGTCNCYATYKTYTMPGTCPCQTSGICNCVKPYSTITFTNLPAQPDTGWTFYGTNWLDGGNGEPPKPAGS